MSNGTKIRLQCRNRYKENISSVIRKQYNILFWVNMSHIEVIRNTVDDES
jgi:hypothetical protein